MSQRPCDEQQSEALPNLEMFLGLEDGLEGDLEDLLNPVADFVSDSMVQGIKGLLGSSETGDAAAGVFDGALNAALGGFGDDLSDLFVRAAQEGVSVFKDLDDLLVNAAGTFLNSISASIPGGLGPTLLGGQAGYDQFLNGFIGDAVGGIFGGEGSGPGFDFANGIISGEWDDFFGGNQALVDFGASIGLDGEFWGKTFNQFDSAGLLGGAIGSALAGFAGFEGSGDPLIDAGLGLVGNIGGAALGTALTPALGAIAGPLGIAVGAFLAPAIGSLLKDEDYPFASATLGIKDGELAVLRTHELDGGPLGQVKELGDGLTDAFDDLLKSLGGRIDGGEGEVLTSIGYASGRSDGLGTGFFAGANASFNNGADFTRLEGQDVIVAGLLTALQTGIETGVITGLSDTVATAIAHIDTADFDKVEELLTFAVNFDATLLAFSEGASDPQATARGEVEAAIASVITQIEDFREKTVQLGLPLDKANVAMKKYAEVALGFGDLALDQVSEVELELRRIAELRTLTNKELEILQLTNEELDAGLIERQRRFTERFLDPFNASAKERNDPGSTKLEDIVDKYQQTIADALLLNIEDLDNINAHFADAFRNLFDEINATALAEAERAQASFGALGESLRDAYQALYFGDGGPGTAEEELVAAQAKFDDVAARALAGDEEALGELGGLAQELIAAYQAVYSSGTQTAEARLFVLSVLEDAALLSETNAATAEADIARLSTEGLSEAEIFAEAGIDRVSNEQAIAGQTEGFVVEAPIEDVVDEEPVPVEEDRGFLERYQELFERLFGITTRFGDDAFDQRETLLALIEELLAETRQTRASLNA